MPPTAIVSPTILKDPGYLFIAPVGTAAPTNTPAASVFSDAWAAAWIPLGATEDGSQLTYSTEIEAITVAEFLPPIAYATTGAAASIAFNLASITLTNYRRALNGGVAALTPTSGTGATALYTFTPPVAGSEVRCMIGWESLDNTMRLVAYQCIQGGEMTSAFAKAPALAMIPCTFNMEIPTSRTTPYDMWAAGDSRGGV